MVLTIPLYNDEEYQIFNHFLKRVPSYKKEKLRVSKKRINARVNIQEINTTDNNNARLRIKSFTWNKMRMYRPIPVL